MNLRQSGTFFLLVYGFSAWSAGKPYTGDETYHAAAGRIRSKCGLLCRGLRGQHPLDCGAMLVVVIVAVADDPVDQLAGAVGAAPGWRVGLEQIGLTHAVQCR